MRVLLRACCICIAACCRLLHPGDALSQHRAQRRQPLPPQNAPQHRLPLQNAHLGLTCSLLLPLTSHRHHTLYAVTCGGLRQHTLLCTACSSGTQHWHRSITC